MTKTRKAAIIAEETGIFKRHLVKRIFSEIMRLLSGAISLCVMILWIKKLDIHFESFQDVKEYLTTQMLEMVKLYDSTIGRIMMCLAYALVAVSAIAYVLSELNLFSEEPESKKTESDSSAWLEWRLKEMNKIPLWEGLSLLCKTEKINKRMKKRMCESIPVPPILPNERGFYPPVLYKKSLF